MAHHRNTGGLDISGVGRRGRGSHAPGRMKSSGFGGLSSGSKGRSGKASDRAALARAAKGRGTYIHPSGYGKHDQRSSRKTLLIVLAVTVFALLLAVLVGYLVYQQAARNALKPTLNTQELEAELTDVKTAKDPFWTVLVDTDASSAEAGRGNVENLALVYVDPDNVSITFLWIPTDTRVYIDGLGYRKIGDAFTTKNEAGEASLTAAVEKLAGIDATHYIEMNDAGLNRLEQLLSPLSVDAQTAGNDALATALSKKIFGSSSESIKEVSSALTTCVATDATSDEVTSAVRSLHGISMDTACFNENMPSTTQTIDGTEYSVCSTDSWNTMVTRTRSGMSPVASSTEVSTNSVTRDKCTVAVWNGVGVSGVASDCTNQLKKLGWNVISSGNAAQFVYTETLVVYKDTDDEAAARLLVADLGQGRVVRSAARYAYTGNLLVVVGKDYKPY